MLVPLVHQTLENEKKFKISNDSVRYISLLAHQLCCSPKTIGSYYRHKSLSTNLKNKPQ